MIKVLISILGLIAILCTIVTFIFNDAGRRFGKWLCEMHFRLFAACRNLLAPLHRTKISFGGISTNRCSFCGDPGPTRFVNTEGGRQMDMCKKCMDKRILKKGNAHYFLKGLFH